MNMIQMSLCHCVNLYPWPTSLSKGSYALQLLVAGLCWQDQHRWVGAAQLIAVLVDRMGSSRIKWLFHWGKWGFSVKFGSILSNRNQLSSELVATLISWRHTLRPRICWQNLGSERMISGRTTRKARVKFGRSSLMVKVHHWCNYVTVCHYVNEWFMPLSILNHNRTTTVQFSSNLAKYNQLSSKIIKDLQISSTSVKDHQKPSSSVIYHEISWNIINDNQISSIRININDHQISSLIMKYHHMSSIIINYKSDFWNPPASHVWYVSMVLLSLCFELKI